MRKLSRFKFASDIVVPRKAIGALLEQVAQAAAGADIRTLSYRHAGDGAIHVNFLWDDVEQRPKVEALVGGLFRQVVALNPGKIFPAGAGVTL